MVPHRNSGVAGYSFSGSTFNPSGIQFDLQRTDSECLALQHHIHTGNPKTREKVSVPGKYVPHLKAGKELRDRVDLAARPALKEAA